MKKLAGLIEVGLAVTAAYHKLEAPRRRFVAQGALGALAALLALTALGLGLAAAWHGIRVALSPALASLLTAGIALGLAVGAALAAKGLRRRSSR